MLEWGLVFAAAFLGTLAAEKTPVVVRPMLSRLPCVRKWKLEELRRLRREHPYGVWEIYDKYEMIVIHTHEGRGRVEFGGPWRWDTERYEWRGKDV